MIKEKISKNHVKLSKNIVEYIIKEIIIKLFPNTKYEYSSDTKNQKQVLAQINNRPTDKGILCEDGGRFEFKRAQKFSKTESSIIENIISIASGYSSLDENQQKYLVLNTMSQVIAKHLSDVSGILDSSQLARMVDKLEHWAHETYEGQSISVAFAINNNETLNSLPKENTLTFESFSKEDFSKVLSNGHDTLVELTSQYNFLDYKVLSLNMSSVNSPFRYSTYANYTNNNKCIVFVLNRNSELLIFNSGKLSFAKRRGDWRFFSEHITRQMRFKARGIAAQEDLFSSIYASILDVSFARTGACIGIINSKEITNFRDSNLVKKEDYLSSSKQIKSILLNNIVNQQLFHTLDRRIRQELLSIDGSLILSARGEILAVGAILQIQIKEDTYHSHATGGARLAAAKALSEFGVSFKVSTDGEVTVLNKKELFIFG